MYIKILDILFLVPMGGFQGTVQISNNNTDTIIFYYGFELTVAWSVENKCKCAIQKR